MASDESHPGMDQLLDGPDLAEALGSDLFKQFLDQVPFAIAVSKLNPAERVVYANIQFQTLTGQASANILGGSWDPLPGQAVAPEETRTLGQMVSEERDYLGAFNLPHSEATITLGAWSNIIVDDLGAPAFRLVALVETGPLGGSVLDELQALVLEKDTHLRELQHRVKNNLQMITALIRVEARGVVDASTGEGFDRLAGRVEALGLLYRALEHSGAGEPVDLGIYLSEIASAVMRAHAHEGIRLDLKVDTWPVSIDVAMPTGLVVNELLTNALKHAFTDREGGTITLHSTTENGGCRVVISDDGIGLPEGISWPKKGKLSELIVRSLLQNARAEIDVKSIPAEGMQVTICFDCETAEPGA